MLSENLNMFSFVSLEMKELIKKRFLNFNELTNVDFLIIFIRESFINESVQEKLKLFLMLLTGWKN